MFKFITETFSSLVGGSYLGVDIGTTSIKVVEVGIGVEKPVLRNYGILESYEHLDRPTAALQGSGLALVERETGELLKLVIERMRTRARSVVATVPPFAVFSSYLEVPIVSEKEIARAMEYQARAVVPLPVNEVVVEWFMLGGFEDEKGVHKQKILLVATPKELIARYERIAAIAGLKLRGLEIEGASLARSVARGERGEVLLVDLGARSTGLYILDEGRVKISSQTDFSAGSLTRAVAQGMGIASRRAEELKRRRGLVGTGGEYELSTLMLPYVDVILGEVRRFRDTYAESYHGTIKKALLTGGGSNLLGLVEYASSELGIPVALGAPFARLSYDPFIEPLTAELSGLLAASIGAGIKQFVDE